MNFHDLRIIVSQIKKTIFCAKCKGHYHDEDIEVIGSLGDEQIFMHASCAECETETVINVALHMEGDFEILPPFKKLGTAPRMENISVNEVLDVHNFLKDFKGDFKEIFENQQNQAS